MYRILDINNVREVVAGAIVESCQEDPVVLYDIIWDGMLGVEKWTEEDLLDEIELYGLEEELIERGFLEYTEE